MLWAAAMVAVFLLLLSLLHCLGKVHYEFFSHALNSIGVLTFGTLFLVSTVFFQIVTCTAGVLAGWVPFSFCKGKKLVTLGLLVLSAAWL